LSANETTVLAPRSIKLAGVAGVYNKHRYVKEMAAAWKKWCSHISEIALTVRKA
jgi:hypothetical protein